MGHLHNVDANSMHQAAAEEASKGPLDTLQSDQIELVQVEIRIKEEETTTRIGMSVDVLAMVLIAVTDQCFGVVVVVAADFLVVEVGVMVDLEEEALAISTLRCSQTPTCTDITFQHLHQMIVGPSPQKTCHLMQ